MLIFKSTPQAVANNKSHEANAVLQNTYVYVRVCVSVSELNMCWPAARIFKRFETTKQANEKENGNRNRNSNVKKFVEIFQVDIQIADDDDEKNGAANKWTRDHKSTQ